MSDQDNADNGNGTGAPGQGDSRTIESIQAEMARKTDKLSQENQRLSQQMEQLMGMLNKQTAPANSHSEEVDLEDLAFKDPKAYARKVREQAVQDAQKVISQTFQQQNQTNAVLSQLTNEYPELADGNSELTKKAVETYKNMSEADRMSPIAYKTAVRDAAADLGLLPKNKRKQMSDDDFSLSGKSGSGSQPSRSRSEQKEIDNKTEAFAQLLGIDVNDKKKMDRIKQRAQRKNWGKWE